MKRMLSLLLVTLMIAGSVIVCIPATVSAAPRYEGSGSGTVATEEDTQAVEEAVGYTQLPIGGWGTLDNFHTQRETKDIYTKLKDAGLNYMISNKEIYSVIHTSRSLGAAYEVGMDMYLNTIYNKHTYEENIDLINLYKTFPNLKGFWFGDKPRMKNMPSYTSSANKLMAAMNNADFSYGGNMFPSYAYQSLEEYEQYLEAYASGSQKYDDNNNKIDNLSADFICFDYYPFGEGTGDFIPGLVENLAVAKSVADKNGIDMYSYIQSSGWAGYREPNQTELLYSVHMNLATGVKGLVYYLACKTDSYTAMLNSDGSYGSSYFKVQQTNEMIEKLKGVYLDFDNEGFISIGDSELVSKVDAIHPEYLLDSYKQLTSAEASKAFIGCFTKGEGDDAQTGLYVVNQNYTSEDNSEVTLNLDGTVSYQIWGSEGLEQMGTDSKLVLSILPGDAKFVILNSVNDASAYTPAEPKPEKPDFDEARINRLVFDLGFDDDGVPYNKVPRGIGLMDGAYGTVTTNDDKTVLTDYSFQTEMIKNLYPANCGVTVELYVKFTAEDDVDVYRDKLSNFHLYRWSESNKVWFGMAQGIDLMKGSARENLPKDQWLHIVTTQTRLDQALYVNGNKALGAGGGYNFDPTYISSILFEAGETVFLKDLRVYTYAVDQEEAVMMYKDYIGEPTGALDGFEDLEAGAWYEEALETVVRRNLFRGMLQGEFRPDVDMSRAMFVMVLSRLVKADLSAYEDFESPFDDVTTDQWLYEAVCWAYDNGLVSGMTPTTFGPDGKLTREQMCVLIVRFAEKYGYDLSETVDAVTFEDENKIGTWAIEAVKTCQKAGIVSGMTPTTFVPGGNASRAQVAMIFTRLMNK